jgi:hypothetical protein
MKITTIIAGAAALWSLCGAATAQVAADLVAVSGTPAGSIFAPHTPAGVVIIGKDIWVGDEAQGLRHYIPVDPANSDPINVGQLMFDVNTEWSMGGGTACTPWCGVGQIAQDGSNRAYVTSYDHTKGQPGFFGGGGVWMVSFQGQFGDFSPFAGLSPVASSAAVPLRPRAGDTSPIDILQEPMYFEFISCRLSRGRTQ